MIVTLPIICFLFHDVFFYFISWSNQPPVTQVLLLLLFFSNESLDYGFPIVCLHNLMIYALIAPFKIDSEKKKKRS